MRTSSAGSNNGLFVAAALMGAFVLTGCSGDRGSDDEAGTTTTQTSSSDDASATDSSTDATQTSTDTGTDNATTNTSNSGGSFYAGPDPDLPTDSNWCDPWTQDCPEGEKCVPYASSGGTWDANKCVTVLGDGMPGEACIYAGAVEATDDCDETSVCQQTQLIDGQVIGTCVEFCKGQADDPICDQGQSCMIANEGSINVCLSNCDPVAQDCPIAGNACTDVLIDSIGFTCWPVDEQVGVGEPCDIDQTVGCAPGNECAAGSFLPACAGDSCCVQYCPLDGVDPCEPLGTECVAFFDDPAPPGYENIGVCISP